MNPAAGAKVTSTTPVNLVVAQAPPTAAVPNVVGDTVPAATNALKAAGFKVAQTTQTVNHMSRNGIVISQSPKATNSAPKNSTVTIVVGHYNKPPPTTTTSTTTTADDDDDVDHHHVNHDDDGTTHPPA